MTFLPIILLCGHTTNAEFLLEEQFYIEWKQFVFQQWFQTVVVIRLLGSQFSLILITKLVYLWFEVNTFVKLSIRSKNPGRLLSFHEMYLSLDESKGWEDSIRLHKQLFIANLLKFIDP